MHSLEALRGAVRTASAAVLPYSASPVRADPRPPTCRSVGHDVARTLQEVSRDDPVVTRCILEHVQSRLPSEAWPAQQPTPDDLVAAQLLKSMKEYVCGPLALSRAAGAVGGGTRQKAAQQALHTLAAAVHSDEVGNVAAACRMTGLSRRMWENGQKLRQQNTSADGAPADGAVSLGGERATRADKKDLQFLYDWFHKDSPDVEPDKSVKWNYKRKKVYCAGEWRMITCRPNILTCSVAEATQHAMESDAYKRCGYTLHPKTVAGCICNCIKPVKREECACPTCAEFVEALVAYNNNRRLWHSGEDTRCSGECGLGCKDPDSEFRTFTRNHSEFEQKLRCPKRQLPHLKLPHEEEGPEFYKLNCCLRRRRNAAGEPTGEHEPRDALPCEQCGPKRRKLLQAPGEKKCADEHNDEPAMWRKYKEIELEEGKFTNKLVEHHGTRRELLEQIERTAQEWSFHRFVKDWQKHQARTRVRSGERRRKWRSGRVPSDLAWILNHSTLWHARSRG